MEPPGRHMEDPKPHLVLHIEPPEPQTDPPEPHLEPCEPHTGGLRVS